MALVGDTLVDADHFSGHPCILTTYLVLRLKSGFFLNFFAKLFWGKGNFYWESETLYPLGGGGFLWCEISWYKKTLEQPKNNCGLTGLSQVYAILHTRMVLV